MGPLEENSISELTLRPINPDGSYGDPIEFENFENVTYSLDENVDEFYTVGFDLAKGSDMTAYGYIELPHFRNPFYNNDKKISRKKFKKWLMHFPWIHRNEAEAYCQLIGITKGRISYGTTYQDVAFLINFERPSIVLFNSFVKQLKETEK